MPMRDDRISIDRYRSTDEDPSLSFERRLVAIEGKLVLMQDQLADVHGDVHNVKMVADAMSMMLIEETNRRNAQRESNSARWIKLITIGTGIAITVAAILTVLRGATP
jgi:hypothetical protein